MSEAVHFWGFDDFVAAEQRATVRHELVGGRTYLMAGGTERHDVLVNAVSDALRPGARSLGCRTFSSNRLVRTRDDSGYYPDFLVTCRRAADSRFEADADLVVEVLSPSMVDRDRREKAIAYATLPSMQLLLLVDQDGRRIEVARFVGDRIAGWDAYGPGSVVLTPWGDLDVDALYEAADAETST